MPSLTPRFPLHFGDEPSYQNITSIKELVKQNLKNLCLCSPGERLMNNNFGVGMKRFLFEPNLQTTYGKISAKLTEQVATFMPFLEIDDITITTLPDSDGNAISVSITYYIRPVSETDILNLSMSR